MHVHEAYRMKETSPSHSSRDPLGLWFTEVECQEGEGKIFIKSLITESGNYRHHKRWLRSDKERFCCVLHDIAGKPVVERSEVLRVKLF